MHGNSHEGMALSSLWSLMLPMLIKVKQQNVGWASSVFVNVCIALLCRFVLRLSMWLVVLHDSRWRHVSFWWNVHRLHVGDMSCLWMSFFWVVP